MHNNQAIHKRNIIESKMNGKKVLHNGTMGVYQDYQQVKPEEVNNLKEVITKTAQYLREQTSYIVNEHTYGVQVVFKDSYGDELKAFVGYDERADNRVTLCYATETFLGMHIMNQLNSLDSGATFVVLNPTKEEGNKKVTLNTVNGTGDSKLVEESKVNQESESKYLDTWGKPGREEILNRLKDLKDKVGYLGNSLEKHKIVNKEEKEVFIKDTLSDVMDEGVLVSREPFEEGRGYYKIAQSILTRVSDLVPNTSIKTKKNEVEWQIDGFEEPILRIYNKVWLLKEGTNQEEDNTLVKISIEEDTPNYVNVRKLIDALQANVGYKRILKRVEEVGTDVKVGGEVNEKEVIKPFKTGDYYDMYLATAGQWGKDDGKYESEKEVLSELVNELGLQSVLLQVESGQDSEKVVDVVYEGNTYTIALTGKATSVKVLEKEYKRAIAYDTKHPELLGELIKDKLEDVL